MILDRLPHWRSYQLLSPRLTAAFEFLSSLTVRHLEDGRHELDGSRVFAIVSSDTGKGRSGARLEAHERYLDIQYILAGHDLMGWRSRPTCRKPCAPFDRDRDIIFFDDEPTCWFDVPEHHFAVFHPEDAHAPLAGEGPVRKIIVKVAWDDRSAT